MVVTEHCSDYSGRQAAVGRGPVPFGEILCPAGTSFATKGK